MKHTLIAFTIALSLIITPLQSVHGATTTDNTALIQKLLAQIVVLQAELNKLIVARGGSTTSTTPSCTFTRTLYLGTQGTDVTCLQTYLKKKGHFTGTATGFYGPQTKDAVYKWQMSTGIIPEPKAIGMFGPRSQESIVDEMKTTPVITTNTPTTNTTPKTEKRKHTGGGGGGHQDTRGGNTGTTNPIVSNTTTPNTPNTPNTPTTPTTPTTPKNTPNTPNNPNTPNTPAPAPKPGTATVPAPSAPTNLVGSEIAQNRATLSWNASTDAVGVAAYNVYQNGALVRTVTTPTVVVLDLLPNTQYSFTVRAQNAKGGLSGVSNTLTIKTLASTSSSPPTQSASGWYSVPNTQYKTLCPDSKLYPGIEGNVGCQSITEAWGSGVLDTKRNRLVFLGGGTTNYYGNEIYAFNIDTQTLERIKDPATPLASFSRCTDAIGNPPEPNARQTYNGLVYVPTTDEMFLWNGATACGAGTFYKTMWVYNFGTKSWRLQQTTGPLPAKAGGIGQAPAAAYDSFTDKIYIYDGFELWAFDPHTYVFEEFKESLDLKLGGISATAVIDPKRHKFYIFGGNISNVIDITPGASHVTQKYDPSGDNSIVITQRPGLAYNPKIDKIVAWNGGDKVSTLDTEKKLWTSRVYPGGPARAGQGTFGRFVYSSKSDKFVEVSRWNENVDVLTLADPKDDAPGSDFIPPTVTLTAPTSASGLTGTITLSADASDNVKVASVQFAINGNLLGNEITVAPYTMQLPTILLNNKIDYRITARAKDTSGNITESTWATISANNAVIPKVIDLPCGYVPAMEVTQSDTIIDGHGCATMIGLSKPTRHGALYIPIGVNNVTVKNLKVSLGDPAYLEDNRACLRPQGTNLTLINVELLWPCGDGALSSRNAGTWVIEDSHLDKTGGHFNEGHAIYHCGAGCLPGEGAVIIRHSTLLNCRYRTDANGEAAKSRGALITITDSILGGNLKESNCDKAVSMPNGGGGTISDSILLQGPSAGSDVPVGYGAEARCGKGGRIAYLNGKTDPKCVLDGESLPAGYIYQNEHHGDMLIERTIIICDRKPCRFAVLGHHTLTVKDSMVVGYRAQTDPAFFQSVDGGQLKFINTRFCATRAECGLPAWPAIPTTASTKDLIPDGFLVGSPIPAPGTVPPATTTPATVNDTTAPTIPTNLLAVANSSSQITLSWNASTDAGGLKGYNIYRVGTVAPLNVAPQTNTTFTQTGLNPATAYTYQVEAIDNAGNKSVKTASVSVTTLALSTIIDTTKPTTPGTPTASLVTQTTLRLTWTASTDAGGSNLTGYKIYRNGTQMGTPTTNTYDDTNLIANTAYSYSIVAYDGAGNTSATSTAQSATTLVVSPSATTTVAPAVVRTVQTVVPALPAPSRNPAPALATQVASMKVGQWAQISGDNKAVDVDPEKDPIANPKFPATSPWHATSGFRSVWEAWNSGGLASNFGPCGSILYYGGGHLDYYGNEVIALNLCAGIKGGPVWQRLSNPYKGPIVYPTPNGAYPDGTPSPAHTYDAVVVGNNKFMVFNGELTNRPMNATSSFMFDLTNRTWTGPLMHAGNTRGASAWDSKRNLAWNAPSYDMPGGKFSSFNPETKTFTNYFRTDSDPAFSNLDSMMAYDPDNDKLVISNFRGIGASPEAFGATLAEIDPANPNTRPVIATQIGKPAIDEGQHAFSWSPKRHAFIVWMDMLKDDKVYEVKRTGVSVAGKPEYTWTLLTDPINTVVPITTAHNGSYDKFQVVTIGNDEVLIGQLTLFDGIFAFKIPPPGVATRPTKVPLTSSQTKATLTDLLIKLRALKEEVQKLKK